MVTISDPAFDFHDQNSELISVNDRFIKGNPVHLCENEEQARKRQILSK